MPTSDKHQTMRSIKKNILFSSFCVLLDVRENPEPVKKIKEISSRLTVIFLHSSILNQCSRHSSNNFHLTCAEFCARYNDDDDEDNNDDEDKREKLETITSTRKQHKNYEIIFIYNDDSCFSHWFTKIYKFMIDFWVNISINIYQIWIKKELIK